jgi:hypothetical protein
VQDYRDTVDCEVWNNTQVDQIHFSHVEDRQSLVDYCKLVCYTSKLPHCWVRKKRKSTHVIQFLLVGPHREGFDKTCKMLTDQLHLKRFHHFQSRNGMQEKVQWQLKISHHRITKTIAIHDQWSHMFLLCVYILQEYYMCMTTFRELLAPLQV